MLQALTRSAAPRALRSSLTACVAGATVRAAATTRCFVASTATASATPAPAASATVAAAADSTPLVAPEFGTNGGDRRFVYIKGVKNDGRSKRFYAHVDLQPVATHRGEELGVLLDGRFVVTPYNQILSAPTLAAATAIAFEWDSQGDFIRPASMPLTNICVTALDQAYTDRNRFLTHFRNSMQTDSVFLRMQSPSGLVSQQRKQWDPLLKWMRERYDCDLQTTFEIETPEQTSDAMSKQYALLSSLTGWQLAALDSLTTVTKSFVISWALLSDRITIAQAFEAARLEENFQMRQYGQVEGVYGHGIEMEFTRMSLAAAKTWVNIVSTDPTENPLLNPNLPTAKQ